MNNCLNRKSALALIRVHPNKWNHKSSYDIIHCKHALQYMIQAILSPLCRNKNIHMCNYAGGVWQHSPTVTRFDVDDFTPSAHRTNQLNNLSLQALAEVLFPPDVTPVHDRLYQTAIKMTRDI